MKTTIEIPDRLLRRVKSRAAERDQTLKEFVNEALQEKLASRRGTTGSAQPEWMLGFGKLRHLHKETERIQERIREAFETV
jgi:predicted transcriptional regulator